MIRKSNYLFLPPPPELHCIAYKWHIVYLLYNLTCNGWPHTVTSANICTQNGLTHLLVAVFATISFYYYRHFTLYCVAIYILFVFAWVHRIIAHRFKLRLIQMSLFRSLEFDFCSKFSCKLFAERFFLDK